ncbi:MAG TPA: hypothetical protein VFE94_00360 [Candidatus Paceibacterota bacterium]|nr:hypothetical protein [Candidatus Paceibacterota bacterium]
MTESNALYNDLLSRARQALPFVSSHPREPGRAEAAILLAEESGQEHDLNIAKRLVDELAEPEERLMGLEDIAKITQQSEDRLAALQADDAYEGTWQIDKEFTPGNISFSRSILVWFSPYPITQEAISSERNEARAELLQSHVSQLVDQGRLEDALFVAESLRTDALIEDGEARERFWGRCVGAVAVGYARAGNFSQANDFAELIVFLEDEYIELLVEIARTLRTTKEDHPNG